MRLENIYCISEFHEKGEVMIITFVGHGSLLISQEITEKITDTIKNNVKDQEFVSFYCGGYDDR